VTVAYRPLVYVTFDAVGARAAGLAVGRYNQVLAVLTAVVVGAMQIMGVILVAAMLVVPVATATVVRGFKRSIAAAVVVGLVATTSGVTLSYLFDIAAGGTIVIVAIGLYAATRGGQAVAGQVARRQHTQTTTTAPSAPGSVDSSDDAE
jgi:zinc transport system permease protein